jgi:hypothetical protein
VNDNFGVLARNPDWETKLILNRIRNACALRELGSEQERHDVEGENKKGDKGCDEQNNAEARADLERRIRDITAMERSLRKRSIPR